MRQGSHHWERVFNIDVARVGRLLQLVDAGAQWQPPENDPQHRIIIARTRDTLRRALGLLRSGFVSFDVETVGLGPTETALVCFGLSDGNTTVVVPWSLARDGAKPWWSHPREVADEISAAMRRMVIVTHNGPAFDHIVAMRHWLQQRHGIIFDKWEDTILAYHDLHSHYPKHLAHVVTQYLDVPPWKQLEDRTADLERLWFYNARDCLYTILAWRPLWAELQVAA
jgi:hypothetical protein